MSNSLLIVVSFLGFGLLVMVASAAWEDFRERRRRRGPSLRDLALLHSINLDRCIGCEGCVDACPTNVLEMRDHKVFVARFDQCVQCEQCAWACPTKALVMHREDREPEGLVVPELDEHFQTSVPGQYLIGEVAGKPLVKNAANLGRMVVEHMRSQGLRAEPGQGTDLVDVIIIGSGPGGLSAALACQAHGLSCMVIEKEHAFASTIARYPKGKSFMPEPLETRNLSFLPVFEGTKEDLLAVWQEILEGVRLPIRTGEAVESIDRDDGGVFGVKTTVGSYRARRIILATGLRGKPRLLTVPGANLPKVHSFLEDATVYGGQSVLVVGGGDSALEAAMSLADAGARPTLSYRGDSFNRAKQANQQRIRDYQSSGRVEVFLESNATGFEESTVTIKLASGEERTIENHAAFVLIGGDAPVPWLEKLGVKFVTRPHSYQLGATDALVQRLAPTAQDCQRIAKHAIAAVMGRPVAPQRTARPAAAPPVEAETKVFLPQRGRRAPAFPELAMGTAKSAPPPRARASVPPPLPKKKRKTTVWPRLPAPRRPKSGADWDDENTVVESASAVWGFERR